MGSPEAEPVEAFDENGPQPSTLWTAAGLDPQPPNVTLVSSDNVLFHVHRHRLLLCSRNALAGLLSSHTDACSSVYEPFQVVRTVEDAAVLGVILSAVYGISSGTLNPLEVLVLAIKSLSKYGMRMQELVVPHRLLGEQLLAHAHMQPMEVYVLAAEHQLEAIAMQTSSYLLAYPIAQLPITFAVRMGTSYLRRLYMLQSNRMSKLKYMVYSPLECHLVTQKCAQAERKWIVRTWATAIADLAWTAKGGECLYVCGPLCS